MSKLQIGIVGTSRGKSFYDEFNKIDDVEIIGVMDLDKQALANFKQNNPVEYTFTNYEELLHCGIDIVVIASPIQFHAQQAISALEKDIHVLSEVTAATTIEDCKRLMKAVKESKAQYMLAENYCYIRENIAVSHMIEAGLFGDIYYAEGEYLHNVTSLHYDETGKPTWRRTETVSKRGCTYGTHSLGPILEWFDEPIQYVNCLGTGSHTVPGYENDDTTLMLCRTESGALIKIRLDMVSNRPHNMSYYTLQGTKGCYETPRVPGEKHRVWLKDYAQSNEKWLLLSDFYDEFLPKELITLPEKAKRSGHWGADYFLIRDFVKCIRENKPVPIDIYKALEFTLPGILSEKSIALSGEAVKIPDIRKW